MALFRSPQPHAVFSRALIAFSLFTGSSARIRAATDTWTGGSTTNNWTDASNWTPAAPTTGDSLLYTGTAPRLTSNNNNASTLTVAGITFDATAAAYTLTGTPIVLSADITNNSASAEAVNLSFALQNPTNTNIQSLAGGTITLGGNISGAGTPLTIIGTNSGGTLTANGTNSTTTISGANTYTGATRFTGGNVTLGYATNNNNKVDVGSTLTLGGAIYGGVNVTMSGNAAATQSVAGTVIDAGNSTINNAVAGAVLNLGAVSSRDGGTLSFLSTGTANLGTTTAGSNVNGILGGFAIITNAASNPTAANFVASGGTAGTPGTLGAFNAYTTDFTVPNANIAASGTLAPAAFTINSLKLTNATALTLTGANTITSGGLLYFPTTAAVVTIAGGSLTSGSSDLNIFVSGSANGFTINSALTGNMGLTIAPVSANSAAAVTLGGNNTFTGNIAITRGVLALNSLTALPSATTGGTITLNTVFGSSVATVLQDVDTTDNLTINASKFRIVGSGGVQKSGTTSTNTLSLLGAHAYTGVTTISGGTLQIDTLANGGTASSLGAASNAAANLVLNNGGAGTTATLQYIGAGGSTDRGFTLSTGNTVTSVSTLDSSGTGPISFTNASGTGAVAFSGSTGAAAPTLVLTGTNTGANTLALNIGAASTTGTAVAARITKNGAGTWVLGGANSYTGVTAVNAGVLLVNGSHTGAGAYTVAGGTLGGGGTINTGANAVNIGNGTAGGTITGGAVGTAGILTLTTTAVNGVFFNGTSTSLSIYTADVTSSGADKLVVNGLLNLSGSNDRIVINNVGPLGAGTYALATYTSLSGMFDTTTGLASNESLVYTSATGPGELDLVIAVPEPSTWAAILCGVGILGGTLIRRRAR